jgi:RNA polymerase sigma factor (sigma-70 family)
MTVALRNNLIKSRRLERGWSQKELAKRAGVSVMTVGSMETFRRNWSLAAPSLERVAAALGCGVEELVEPWMGEIQKSRTTKLLSEEDLDLVPFSQALALPAPGSVEDQASHNELKRIIAQGLETLTPREELVLRLYYGLDGDEPMTYNSIGADERFQVTGYRISQIAAKAIRKLRSAKNCRPRQALKDFDLECRASASA